MLIARRKIKLQYFLLAIDCTLFSLVCLLWSLVYQEELGTFISFSVWYLNAIVYIVNLYLFANYTWDTIPVFSWRVKQKLAYSFLLVLVEVLFFKFVLDNLFELKWYNNIYWSLAISFFSVSYIARLFFYKYLSRLYKNSKILLIAEYKAIETFKNEVKNNSLNASFVLCKASKEHPDELTVLEEGISEIKPISDVLYMNEWSGIVTSSKFAEQDLLGKELMSKRFSEVPIFSIDMFYEENWFKVPLYSIDFPWFTFTKGFKLCSSVNALRFKRLFDIFISLILLFTLFPVMVIVALFICLDSKGSIVYSQVRSGKDNKPFTIFKFRTMTLDAEKDGAVWAKKGDTRITKVGGFLRKTRLDELPQLINVILGEMSFIGPRPERPEFNGLLANQIPHYNVRSLVKPGITGWAQVLYPYGASIEDAKEKLQYDIYYIKNYSFLLDVNIIFKTLKVVFRRAGR